MTFNQVSQDSLKNRFQFSPADNKRLFNTDIQSAYWLKFSVINKSNPLEEWLIEFPDHKTDQIDIYYQDHNNNFIHLSAGDILAFENRIYDHKNFLFPIHFNNNEKITFYVRIKGNHLTTLAVWIRSDKKLTGYALSEYIILGLFYGLAGFIAIFNLFLFLTNKDKAYLYYMLYVLSIILYSLSHTGIGFQYIWPHATWWNQNALFIAILSYVIWELLYSSSFLKTKEYHNKLYNFILYFIVFRVAIFMIGIFYRPILSFYPLDIISLVIPLIAGLMAFQKGYKPARFFLIGFLFLYAGFAVQSLEAIGLLSNGILKVYGTNIGATIEIIFLSFAFADRLKIERTEKIKQQEQYLMEMQKNNELKNKLIDELKINQVKKIQINRELELLIDAKTKELQDINKKLQLQSHEIKKINLLLNIDKESLIRKEKEAIISKITKRNTNFEDFKKIYPDDSACFRYLVDLKWENGFTCSKCKGTTCADGAKLFTKRCVQCNYVESATSNTLFHKVKIPINKAFTILYLVTMNPDKINPDDIAMRSGVSKQSSDKFIKKVVDRMKNRSEKSKIEKHTYEWDYLILN